jgi:hypothetical protein
MLAGGACHAQEATAQPSDPKPATELAPNHPPAYQPAPRKPFFKRWFSVEAAGATLPSAILQQIHDWPAQWGKDRLGFEKRVGSLYGQFVVGVTIEDAVKLIHKEDTHYRRLGDGNFFKRTAHVITGTVTARTPDGGRTVAWALPANAYGSWAVATLWSPREFRNAPSILEWGTAGMGGTGIANFTREFWPDIRGIFHKKK